MKASASNDWIAAVAAFIEQWINPPLQFILYLRVPVAIALITVALLTQIDQVLEVYRAIALDSHRVYQALVTTSSVALLSIFVWYTARFLVLEQKESSVQQGLKNWGPRILGVMPIFSLVFGILKAGTQALNSNARAFLITWMGLSAIAGGLILILFWKRTEIFSRFLGSSTPGQGLFNSTVEISLANLAYVTFGAFSLPLIAAAGSTFSLGVIAVFGLSALLNLMLYSWYVERDAAIGKTIAICWIASLLASGGFLFALPPTALPNSVGAISVMAISLTSLVVAFSSIYNWALKKNIPALTILIGLAVVSSYFNWNDNHQFRQIPASQHPPLPALEESFQQWLTARPDRDAAKPYPVYLVSAQGGGIFAAYHTAMALSKLTEYMLTFPQHLFAISSVSGGSVGASAYASLVKTQVDGDPPLSQRASQVFESNLLSPLITFAFFPDLMQRFVPFPIDTWDRAAGLEIAFEQGWEKGRENPLQQSFYRQWQPQGSAPALVLNSTVVQTGERLVVSPFQIVLPTQENIALNEPQLDLRVSTAAGLSARFPFVTPVGWYRRSRDRSKLRLADGGYFDNSGIPTAIDIGRALQKLKGYGKEFELVYLAIVDQPTERSETALKSFGLNEVLSPIQALFSSRGARTSSAIELSTYTLNQGISDPFKLKFRTLLLQKESQQPPIRLPLGWQLSTMSKQFIDGQTPEPSRCDAEAFRQDFVTNAVGSEVNNHNSCVAKSIQGELS